MPDQIFQLAHVKKSCKETEFLRETRFLPETLKKNLTKNRTPLKMSTKNGTRHFHFHPGIEMVQRVEESRSKTGQPHPPT